MLDTNVVAEALLPTSPSHVECLALFEELGNAESVVVFNELLEVELSQVLFVAAIRERHPRKRIKDAATDNRIRPRAARLLTQGRKAWSDLLSTVAYSRIPLGAVEPDVPKIMSDYGLESYDAVHAATAMATGVTDILSLDNGFAKVPPATLALHTTSARVRQTRDRRRRAGF